MSGSSAECCAICLEPSKRRAFVDVCFHSFCLDCIIRWASAVKSPKCPLCNTPFVSVIYDVRSATEFRRFMLDPNGKWGSRRQLSKETDARYAVYGRELFPVMDPPKTNLEWPWKPSVQQEIRRWVDRELRALVDEDDLDVVKAVILAAVQRGGFHTKHLLTVVSPFLFEHAPTFVRELQWFVGSGRSVGAHDAAAVYRSPDRETVRFRDLVRAATVLPPLVTAPAAAECETDSDLALAGAATATAASVTTSASDATRAGAVLRTGDTGDDGDRTSPPVRERKRGRGVGAVGVRRRRRRASSASGARGHESPRTRGVPVDRARADGDLSGDGRPTWYERREADIALRREHLATLDSRLAAERQRLHLMQVLVSGQARALPSS